MLRKELGPIRDFSFSFSSSPPFFFFLLEIYWSSQAVLLRLGSIKWLHRPAPMTWTFRQHWIQGHELGMICVANQPGGLPILIEIRYRSAYLKRNVLIVFSMVMTRGWCSVVCFILAVCLAGVYHWSRTKILSGSRMGDQRCLFVIREERSGPFSSVSPIPSHRWWERRPTKCQRCSWLSFEHDG